MIKKYIDCYFYQATADVDLSDAETGTTEDLTRFTRKQKFSKRWLDDPQFSSWLVELSGENVYQCRCKACGVNLATKKSDLIKHAKTKKHLLSIRSIKNTKS